MYVTQTTCILQVVQSSFFDEYRIEGKDNTGMIVMNLSPDNLAKALSNAANATSVKIKLAKKQAACLSIEIAVPITGNLTI